MFREISVQRLSAGTLFQLAGIGLATTFLPFVVLSACFALFGLSPVTWNEEPLTGVWGLLAATFIGLFFTALLTIFLGSCMVFGLLIYSFFKPLKILAKVSEGDTGA